jgi:hypothetical protein
MTQRAVPARPYEKITNDPNTGDPVVVVDHAGAVVCWGVYNSDSLYRVRVLQMAWEVEVMAVGTKVGWCNLKTP